MIDIHPQYITDTEGNKLSVVLSVGEFEQIMEALEDFEDEQLYALAKQDDDPGLPLGDAIKMIDENKKDKQLNK